MAADLKELLQVARAAQANAYAPYSNFHVGCALVSESGKVFPGCNVENASYGVTICAERTALTSAIVAGERSFTQILIVTDSQQPEAPCGACRQVLVEFGPELEVISVGMNGSERRWKLKELLPAHFELKSSVGA